MAFKKFITMLNCLPGASVTHPLHGHGRVVDCGPGGSRLLVRFEIQKSQTGSDLSEDELHSLGVSPDQVESVSWVEPADLWVNQDELAN